MFMHFFSDFLYKSICCRYSFELHQQVEAIQMGIHNICLYKEADKKYTSCNLKPTKLLDCVLIGVFVVIRLNTVSLYLLYLELWKGENDRRKYFMINLHERMLLTSAGVEPATSWFPVGWRIRLETRRSRVHPRRGRQHSFVEVDHEIFSTVILSLPLIQEGQLSVSGERMCTILVNHLED